LAQLIGNRTSVLFCVGDVLKQSFAQRIGSHTHVKNNMFVCDFINGVVSHIIHIRFFLPFAYITLHYDTLTSDAKPSTK